MRAWLDEMYQENRELAAKNAAMDALVREPKLSPDVAKIVDELGPYLSGTYDARLVGLLGELRVLKQWWEKDQAERRQAQDIAAREQAVIRAYKADQVKPTQRMIDVGEPGEPINDPVSSFMEA